MVLFVGLFCIVVVLVVEVYVGVEEFRLIEFLLVMVS